jgi:hypothetical protein
LSGQYAHCPAAAGAAVPSPDRGSKGAGLSRLSPTVGHDSFLRRRTPCPWCRSIGRLVGSPELPNIAAGRTRTCLPRYITGPHIPPGFLRNFCPKPVTPGPGPSQAWLWQVSFPVTRKHQSEVFAAPLSQCEQPISHQQPNVAGLSRLSRLVRIFFVPTFALVIPNPQRVHAIRGATWTSRIRFRVPSLAWITLPAHRPLRGLPDSSLKGIPPASARGPRRR